MKHDVMGGFDPETFKAMPPGARWTEGYKPLVYICSPFAGDEERNMAKARVYARFAFNKGNIPFCGHIYFPQFCFEEDERDEVICMNEVFLNKCHEVWVFGDEITPGMATEIEKAKENPKVKIRYFTTDFKERKE